jgi:hypothetical protein
LVASLVVSSERGIDNVRDGPYGPGGRWTRSMGGGNRRVGLEFDLLGTETFHFKLGDSPVEYGLDLVEMDVDILGERG